MTLKEAKTRLSIETLWLQIELPGEPGSSCRSPFREDQHPSFSVFDHGLRFYDHSEGSGGDAIDFLRRASGLSPSAACKKFIELASDLPPDPFLIEAMREVQGAALGGRRFRPKKPLCCVELPRIANDIDHLYGRELVCALARLRHVSPDSVRLAHERGLLKFAHCNARGYQHGFDWIPRGPSPVWIITDQTRYNAQLRWLDGSLWEELKGCPKVKTWQGSSANWPVGVNEALPYPLVVLVEGGPDLLAAHHFALLAGVEKDVGVVAMMGAGQKIHWEALPLFTGKRVRITPHGDDAGQSAAERWHDQLSVVDANVDAFRLEGLRRADGLLVKDLNDCCLIHPDKAAELEGMFAL